MSCMSQPGGSSVMCFIITAVAGVRCSLVVTVFRLVKFYIALPLDGLHRLVTISLATNIGV